MSACGTNLLEIEHSSGADILGVKAAGYGGVMGAADDGSAIGEDCEFIAVKGALQEEFVGPHGTYLFQARFERGQVQRARLVLANLDRVPAAECGVNGNWVLQMDKFPGPTSPALRI